MGTIEYQKPLVATAKALGVLQASEYLGISESKLRVEISARRIPYARLGRRIVLRVCDLDGFIEKHMVTEGKP